MSSGPYTRLHLWLDAHRRAVLFATLALSAVCILISSRIDLEEDILATLPLRDQRVDEYGYTLRKFRQIDRVYIDVGIDRIDPDSLDQAADALYSRLQSDPDFARIMYRFELTGQNKIVRLLTGALPNLFTD